MRVDDTQEEMKVACKRKDEAWVSLMTHIMKNRESGERERENNSGTNVRGKFELLAGAV